MYELMPIIDRVKDWNALIILVMAVVIAVLYIFIRMIYPDFYRMVAYRMFVENFSGREITKPTDVSSIEALTTIISLLSISTMLFAAVCYSSGRQCLRFCLFFPPSISDGGLQTCFSVFCSELINMQRTTTLSFSTQKGYCRSYSFRFLSFVRLFRLLLQKY